MKPSRYVRQLIAEYNKRKHEIKKRLRDFAPLYKGRDEDIFSELCFCILTPQAKAVSCDKAVRRLRKSGLLLKGCVGAIRPVLKGAVRFHNKKADYLVGARRLLEKGKRLDIKTRIDANDALKTRDWLAANIKGLGYKEASHFLRNIGLGRDLAILDVHILKNLERYGIIKKIPSSLTKKKYLEIEEDMRKFSGHTGIPIEELDLLFWSIETGYVFK